MKKIILLMVMMVLVAVGVQASLIFHLPFHDGTSTDELDVFYDATGNGHNFTGNGSFGISYPLYNGNGNGSPYSYNISNPIETHLYNESLNFAGLHRNGTVNFWYKFIVNGNNIEYVWNMATNRTGNGSKCIIMHENQNALDLQVWDCCGGLLIDSPDNYVSATNYSMYTFKVNETGTQFYINGTLEASSACTDWLDDIGPSYDTMLFGGYAGVKLDKGYFDEIKYFDEALSDDQIRRLYETNNMTDITLELDNCSIYNYASYIVDFKNAEDYTPIEVNATVNLYGTVDYYFESKSRQNFSICISQSNETYVETIEIQYSRPNVYNYYSAVLTINVTNQTRTFFIEDGSATTTFTTVDENTNEVLPDVLMIVSRRINGTYEITESKYTDVTGRSEVAYASNEAYNFIFTKNGYENYSFSLNPILFDSYTIAMTRSVIINDTLDYARVYFDYEPIIFYDGRLNNFTWSVFSHYGELTDYGVTITYPSGTITQTGTENIGEQLSLNFHINNSNIGDRLLLEYYYTTPIEGTKNFAYYYDIVVAKGNFTMIAMRDKTYGLGIFERVFFAVFMVMLVVGVGTLIGQPVPAFTMGIILYGYFAWIGFVPYWTAIISILLGIIIIAMKPD